MFDIYCVIFRAVISLFADIILGKHGYAKQNLHADRFAHPHFSPSLHFIPNFFTF